MNSVEQMMYSLLCFTTFNCYLFCPTIKMVLHRFHKKGTRALQVQVLIMTHTLAEITAGKSGVAAEAVELIQSHWCAFLFRARSTLSPPDFLQGPSTETVVLF